MKLTQNKKIQAIALVAVVCMAAETPVRGATQIDNEFDGNPPAVGPAWGEYAWGNQTPSLTDVSTGVATVHNANHYRAGFSTTNTVDASSAPGFTVAWSVTSSNATTNAPASSGWFFGVQTAVTNSSQNLWDTSPGFSFGVLMRGGNYSDWVVVDHSDTSIETEHAMSGATPSNASMQDGFTLSITLNQDNTWEVSTTGLSNTSISTGSLSSNVTYSDLAGSLLATTHVQGDGFSYTVDQATLTAVPEPGSLALLAMGGLCVLQRRRN